MDDKPEKVPPPQGVFMDSITSEKVVAALNLRGFGVEHVSIEIIPHQLVRAVVSVYITPEMAAKLFSVLSTESNSR